MAVNRNDGRIFSGWDPRRCFPSWTGRPIRHPFTLRGATLLLGAFAWNLAGQAVATARADVAGEHGVLTATFGPYVYHVNRAGDYNE
jgi:hypothetical protein